MEEKAIIFNGGRDQDIEPLEGADQFLTRLLGAAPSRPAVPYLRVVQSAEGRQCVGVFIGSEHVGYLQSADAEASGHREGLRAQRSGGAGDEAT